MGSGQLQKNKKTSWMRIAAYSYRFELGGAFRGADMFCVTVAIAPSRYLALVSLDKIT